MAPSAGHLLLPKLWRAARFAYAKAYKTIRSKLPEPTTTTTSQSGSLRVQHAYARINSRQPINRAAALRQARRRHYSTRAAGAAGFASALRSVTQCDRAAYRASRIAANVSRLTRCAPFASSLRPSLTGGALCRTAGGYAIGAGRAGGVRYFSHSPATPAQVINNVSVAVRGFFLSGQKVRFDGIDPRTGERRYKTVSPLQDEAERRVAAALRLASTSAPGSSVDFQLSPTMTALCCCGLAGAPPPKTRVAEAAQIQTLHSEGLLDLVAVDFARALKDLAVVLSDLNRLATLGDLPIVQPDRSTIRVRFPGCDAETVERLCDEVGVQRGRVVQDEGFDRANGTDLALLFPFAPSAPASPGSRRLGFAPREPSSFSVDESSNQLDWHAMMSSSGRQGKQQPCSSAALQSSHTQLSFDDPELFGDNPWINSPPASDYSSINVSELGDRAYFVELSSAGRSSDASQYDGFRGAPRFHAGRDRAALWL